MIPMDETLTRVAIDVSNRPYMIWKVKLKVEKIRRNGYRAYLKNGFRLFLKQLELLYTLKIFMVRIVTILLNHVLRDWRDH